MRSTAARSAGWLSKRSSPAIPHIIYKALVFPGLCSSLTSVRTSCVPVLSSSALQGAPETIKHVWSGCPPKAAHASRAFSSPLGAGMFNKMKGRWRVGREHGCGESCGGTPKLRRDHPRSRRGRRSYTICCYRLFRSCDLAANRKCDARIAVWHTPRVRRVPIGRYQPLRISWRSMKRLGWQASATSWGTGSGSLFTQAAISSPDSGAVISPREP